MDGARLSLMAARCASGFLVECEQCAVRRTARDERQARVRTRARGVLLLGAVGGALRMICLFGSTASTLWMLFGYRFTCRSICFIRRHWEDSACVFSTRNISIYLESISVGPCPRHRPEGGAGVRGFSSLTDVCVRAFLASAK